MKINQQSIVTNRKGIILAGGAGTRLYPVTQAVSKQLMPVYDKPMVYYPLTTLMLSGIRDILLITTPQDVGLFSRLLGDGSQWGLNLQYEIQLAPKGLPEAFTIGKKFLDGHSVAMVLGDNIFYGHDLVNQLLLANQSNSPTIFAYRVQDPERYGVVEFDKNLQPISIEEKPVNPQSHYAVTGLYYFDNDVTEIAAKLKPSHRGELEIVDLIRHYMSMGNLDIQLMGRGYAWFDTGTHDSLLDAASFIATLQKRQGLIVACPEEIAYKHGWISKEQLIQLASPLMKTSYGQYLEKMLTESL